MRFRFRFVVAALAAAGLVWAAPALAGLGQPSDWQLGLQQSATPIMDTLTWFHDFLLWIITAITIFVSDPAHNRDGAVQFQGEPGPFQDDPQHVP